MNRREFTTAIASLLAAAPVAQSARTRRYALCPLAEAPATPPALLLQAVVAARLPESFVLLETEMGDLTGPAIETQALPALLELRTYARAQPVLRALATAGIRPWLNGPTRFLIPFESLQHREQFWREVSAGQTWPAYQFAIYRPAPASRTT